MYWLRLDVPKPLQAAVGKTSIKRTLGTKDPVEAKRLFPAALAAAQAEIDAARAALRAAPRRDAESIVNRWFVEQGRRLGSLDFAIDDEGMLLTIRDMEAARAAAWRIANPIAARDIDDWLEKEERNRTADDIEAEQATLEALGEPAPQRLADGRLFVPVKVGYPFLARPDASDTFRTKLRAFERQDYTLGLAKADLARTMLAAAAWRAVDPDVERIARDMDVVIVDEVMRDAMAEAYLSRLAGHVHASNPPNLREALGLVPAHGPAPAAQPAGASAGMSVSGAGGEAGETGQSVRLSEVLEKWSATQKDRNTVLEWRKACSRWISLHGDTPLHMIQRSMVIEFRNVLFWLPRNAPKHVDALPLAEQVAWGEQNGRETLSGATVKKQITAISTLFNHAANELCLVPEDRKNPASNIRVDTDAEQRSHLTDEDVRRIFASDLMTDPAHGDEASRDADYWITLLVALSGARLDEFASLRPGNVRQQDGIEAIFIERDPRSKRRADAAAGRREKRGKTDQSYRVIPIHPIAKQAGFLEYAQARARLGCEWLFELGDTGSGRRSGAISKRLNRMLDEAIGDDTAKVFYSFRHTVKRKLRGKSVSDRVLDALQGHAPRTEGEKYGGVEPAVLQDLVNDLTYDAVDWAPVLKAGQFRAQRAVAAAREASRQAA